jgi:hypothetical protein
MTEIQMSNQDQQQAQHNDRLQEEERLTSIIRGLWVRYKVSGWLSGPKEEDIHLLCSACGVDAKQVL